MAFIIDRIYKILIASMVAMNILLFFVVIVCSVKITFAKRKIKDIEDAVRDKSHDLHILQAEVAFMLSFEALEYLNDNELYWRPINTNNYVFCDL